MTKKEFAKAIADAVKNRLGNNYVTGVIEKNSMNGITKVGIPIQLIETHIGPVIYVDSYYEKLSVEDATEKVLKIFEEHKDKLPNIDAKMLTNWDYVKERVIVRLFNEKTIVDVSQSAGRFGFDDLILVPYIDLGKVGNELLTVRISKELLEYFEDVTVDDIINIGLINTKKECIITDCQGLPFFDLITTKDGIKGAVAVICLRNELLKKHPNGFTVIPSSVDEVLVPCEDFEIDEEYLNGMINQVNSECVANEDFLSNHAYFIKP